MLNGVSKDEIFSEVDGWPAYGVHVEVAMEKGWSKEDAINDLLKKGADPLPLQLYLDQVGVPELGRLGRAHELYTEEKTELSRNGY